MHNHPASPLLIRSHQGFVLVRVRWVCALALLLAAFLVFGILPNRWFHLLAVTSSSMSPTIHAGDLIIVSPPDVPLKPGMIVTLAVDGQLVTHRIIELRPDGSIITQGDASTAPDTWGNAAVQVRGIYRGRIPLMGYLAALPMRLFEPGSTGAWFTDEDRVPGRLALSNWPWEDPAPPDSGCDLGGWLDVDPFFENGRFGIQVSLCLVNHGASPIYLHQILSTIQVHGNGSAGGAEFVDLLSEFLDFSGHPVLYPGETHCYTARILFYAVMDGQYRNLIQVIASGEPAGGPLAGQSAGMQRSMALQDSTGGPLALEFTADFTLPGLDDPAAPTPLPSETATPTLDPLTPTQGPTANATATATLAPTATLEPTTTPTLPPEPPDLPGEDPTATPTPTQPPQPTSEPTAEPTVEPTSQPTDPPTPEPTPEPLPSDTPEPPAPTEEPTQEPTDEPTAEPTDEPAGEPTEEPTEEPAGEPSPEPPTEEPAEKPAGQGTP